MTEEALKALDEIEAALALIANATEAAFESGALFTYEDGEPRPEWANTVTSPFYFGPGILPKVSKAFSLLSTLRAALAPAADGAGEVEAIRARHEDIEENWVRKDRVGTSYMVGMQGHADRATLLRLLSEERVRRVEVEKALAEVKAGAENTIDFYNRNGPQWTSRETGQEYYSASYVMGSAKETIALIAATLTKDTQ